MSEAAGGNVVPYLSYKTYKNFLEGLKGGPPDRIDRSMMGTMAGLVQTQLLGALRFFRLIDAEGKPTGDLLGLLDLTGEESKKHKADLLKRHYKFVPDLKNATMGSIKDAFSKAGVPDSTQQKAVAFYLYAAQDAGLPMSPYLKIRKPPKGSSRRRKADPASGALRPPNEDPNDGKPGNGRAAESDYERLIRILDPNQMNKEEQEAVWTLIRYLKGRENQEGN